MSAEDMKNLINDSKWREYGNENNFLNLSRRRLNQNQKDILSLGMKFNFAHKKPSIVTIEKQFANKCTYLEGEQLLNFNIAKAF